MLKFLRNEMPSVQLAFKKSQRIASRKWKDNRVVENICKWLFDKRFLSRIYKKLLHLNNKKQTN